MTPFNWDDLRVFLAIARHQSAFDAAAEMGMNQSTASRRLQRLEQSIGSKLFERNSRGHRLTNAGHRLLEHVEKLEATIYSMESSSFGDSVALSGDVRIGTTEAFGSFFLAPHLARFCQRHHSIHVDLLPMPRNINLSKREADMSVTLERPIADHFVVVKLLEYRLVPYASRSYLQSLPPLRHRDDLTHLRWVDYVDDMVFTDQQLNLKRVVPDAQPYFCSTSLNAQFSAVRAGMGIGILPYFLCQNVPDLVPVLPEQVGITRTYWLAAPSERRELARVRALWDYLRLVASINADFLMGRSPTPVQVTHASFDQLLS
ncbi:LysR family transcriptional regulator [Lampropedia aestuarii]|uniref:LysR family transcriptional regulator n=1 Tax=Lampropedia aestuarii TaxID=2562762 RepID=UPI0024687359|nr:LysR family transcriptional regulator [Lampropedia aestuarii]MDH5857236.1 LysR family transcriptional regulator [Lampropedia aestuarii]